MGLGKIPAEELDVPPPFVLRRAEKDDREAVQKVVTNAFGMDTGWSDIQRTFGGIIVRNVDAGFEVGSSRLRGHSARKSNHRRVDPQSAMTAPTTI